MFVIRILYFPFWVLSRIVSRRVGHQVFQGVWIAFSDSPPPKATSGEANLAKVVGARMLRSGLRAGTTAAVDRTFAGAFKHVIGAWPGKPAKRID